MPTWAGGSSSMTCSTPPMWPSSSSSLAQQAGPLTALGTVLPEAGVRVSRWPMPALATPGHQAVGSLEAGVILGGVDDRQEEELKQDNNERPHAVRASVTQRSSARASLWQRRRRTQGFRVGSWR